MKREEVLKKLLTFNIFKNPNRKEVKR